jgi:hypothetical protein
MNQNDHLVILNNSFLTQLIWLVVYCISWMVDHLIGQIGQQKIQKWIIFKKFVNFKMFAQEYN